jgi:Bacterial HORMA domain family 1
MSYSYTLSETETFTVTHARHMAAKVATDLKRMQRLYYGTPSDTSIANYEAEITEFVKEGYLGTVTYGFRRDGKWIEPTLQYTARDLAGSAANDDDPGRVRPGANIDGASFYSYMTYSAAWDRLTDAEKDAFRKRLPFTRGGAPEPGVNGYLSNDRTYSSGGRALNRASVRSY